MQALLARGIFRSANRANKILSGVAKPSTATNNTKISKTQAKDKILERPNKNNNDIESLSMDEKTELLKQNEAHIAELKREINRLTPKKLKTDPVAEEKSKSCPYVSALLHIPAKDPKYSLPIPAGDIHITYGMQRGVFRSGFPPFIARKDTLLGLLTNAYNSHYGPKPVVTLITTSSGFGKSRTLIEWAVQVFQQPAVVHAFLQQRPIDATVQQDIAEQIMEAWKSDDGHKKQRAIFLVRLHRTLRESTVISVHQRIVKNGLYPREQSQSWDSVTDAQVEGACKEVIKYALHSRFQGKATKEVPFDYLGPALTAVPLDKLIDLYFKLVEESLPPYELNKPIVTDPDLLYEVMKAGRSLFINIDELQELFSTKSIRAKASNETKNLVHEIARKFVFYRPFIVLNWAGLCTGPIEEIDDESGAFFYLEHSIPMDPLMKMEHINEICKAMFDRGLYSATNPKSLPKDLSLQIHRMWITTSGNARKIESFARALSRQDEMIKKFKHRSSDTLPEQTEAEICRKVYTCNDFASHQKYLGCSDLELSKLVIDAVFGITKAPNDLFGTTTYDDLEGSSILTPHRFIHNPLSTKAERTYTMPFFLHPKSIEKELFGTSNDLENLANAHKIKFDEVKNNIAHAINSWGGEYWPPKWDEEEKYRMLRLQPETPAYTHQILETSTAVHVWFRYLQATNLERGKLVPCTNVLPSTIVNITAFGVIALHKSVGFAKDGVNAEGFSECTDFLFTNKLIAVNKSGSSFADVIVPLYDAEGKPQNILCIQCRDLMLGHSKVKAPYIYSEANKILSASEKFIYVLLSPNVSKADITHRSKKANKFEAWEKSGKFFLSNGDGLLSEWFLRIFREKCQLLNE